MRVEVIIENLRFRVADEAVVWTVLLSAVMEEGLLVRIDVRQGSLILPRIIVIFDVAESDTGAEPALASCRF